jgi:hypothetical protein
MVYNNSMYIFHTNGVFENSFLICTIQLLINITGIIYFTKMMFNTNQETTQTASDSVTLDEGKSGNIRTLAVITDPDEDLDDEIALYHLFERMKSDRFEYDKVMIIFANGANGTKVSSSKRKKVFNKFFPQFDGEDCFVVNWAIVNLVTSSELDMIEGMTIDTLLQIAPLCGMGIDFFTNNTFKRRVVMGDLDNPKGSLNLSKSWNDKSPNSDELDREFKAQEEAMKDVFSHYITTFTYNMISKLPKEFGDYIIKKAFQLLVGRVPSHLPYCRNVTVGANWPTAKSYLKDWDTDDFDRYFNKLTQFEKETIRDQVSEFMSKSSSRFDRNDDEFRQALEDIYIVVRKITGQLYDSADFSVNSLSNVEIAEKLFHEFVRNNKSSLTPAYDLLAMHLVLRKKFDHVKYDENFIGELMEELNIFYG